MSLAVELMERWPKHHPPRSELRKLERRRVRHDDGRQGVIEGVQRYMGEYTAESWIVNVRWDRIDIERGSVRWERCSATELTLLAVPEVLPMGEELHVRKVLFRGSKEQVIEVMRDLRPLDEEKVVAGFVRYAELDAASSSDRRWRVVVVGPDIAGEIRGLSDEAPNAAKRRKDAYDSLFPDGPYAGSW
jgi:hypothetical protein